MNNQQTKLLMDKNFNKIFNIVNKELNIKKPKIYTVTTNRQFVKLYNEKTLFVAKIDEKTGMNYAAVSLILYNSIIFNINSVDKKNIKDEILLFICHELWHLYENSHYSFKNNESKKSFEEKLLLRENQIKNLNSKYYMQIKNYMYQYLRKKYLTDYKVKMQIEYLLQEFEISALSFSLACRNEAPLFHIIFKEIYDIDTLSIYKNLENIKWTQNSSMIL